MDFKNIKNIPHYLFDNLEEYKAFGNTAVVVDSWRAGKEGDWVYTDDGEVKVYINRVGLICDLMYAFNKDNYNFNGNRFVDACAIDNNDDVLEESYR